MSENIQSQRTTSSAAQAASICEFTCVICPAGCFIEAELSGDTPAKLKSLSGNRCEKGETWVRQEIENPMRTVSGSVTVYNGDFICASVRTKNPIPLAKIPGVMSEIRKLRLEAPLSIGDVLLVNPAGANTEIIVTRAVKRITPGSSGRV